MNLESVAARGHRAGGETGCYPYENVARTPMHAGWDKRGLHAVKDMSQDNLGNPLNRGVKDVCEG